MFPVFTKLGAVLVISGMLALSSYGIYLKFTELDFYLLSEEDEFYNTYKYQGLVGSKYGHGLVGVYGKDDKNERWWHLSYMQWKKDVRSKEKTNKLSEEFRDEDKITEAFKNKEGSKGSNRSLNKVCENVYMLENSEIESDDPDDNKSKLRVNMWRYCSPVGEEIKDMVIYKSSRKKLFGF